MTDADAAPRRDAPAAPPPRPADPAHRAAARIAAPIDEAAALTAAAIIRQGGAVTESAPPLLRFTMTSGAATLFGEAQLTPAGDAATDVDLRLRTPWSRRALSALMLGLAGSKTSEATLEAAMLAEINAIQAPPSRPSPEAAKAGDQGLEPEAKTAPPNTPAENAAERAAETDAASAPAAPARLAAPVEIAAPAAKPNVEHAAPATDAPSVGDAERASDIAAPRPQKPAAAPAPAPAAPHSSALRSAPRAAAPRRAPFVAEKAADLASASAAAIERLKALAEARDSGAITKAEFESRKAELLAKI